MLQAKRVDSHKDLNILNGPAWRRPEGLGEVLQQDLVKIVDDSHVPLAEEEQAFSLIRDKVKRGQRLTNEESELLHRLVNKAKEWLEGIQQSAETEPEHTFAG